MGGLEVALTAGTLIAALVAIVPTVLALTRSELRDERARLKERNKDLHHEVKALRGRNVELEEENLRLMRKLLEDKK